MCHDVHLLSASPPVSSAFHFKISGSAADATRSVGEKELEHCACAWVKSEVCPALQQRCDWMRTSQNSRLDSGNDSNSAKQLSTADELWKRACTSLSQSVLGAWLVGRVLTAVACAMSMPVNVALNLTTLSCPTLQQSPHHIYC